MLYEFICECGHKESVNAKMSEISKMVVTCPDCGKQMHQDWCTNFSIPEEMTAQGAQEYAFIKDKMGNLPSGRRKAYY